MSGGSKLTSIQFKIGALCLFLLVISAGISAFMIHVGVNLAVSLVTGTAVAFVIGLFLANRTSKRIKNVTDIAENLIMSDFSKEIDDPSGDEVGRLAKVLNTLRLKMDYTIEEASKEKNKLETILTHMADGVIVVDLNCRITHANPSAKTMLKITDEDIETSSYNDIIHKYDEGLLLENLIKNSEESAVTDTFMYGGATFSVGYDKFKDENELTIGIIIILQDITERNKIENMQVDFVANISHELKTPLTTIKSYTETLLESDVSDKKTSIDFLKIIDSEIDRMNRLVKDLLQLSRVDYKQQKWYMKQGDLISLVRTAVKKMDITAKSKNLQVNLIFDKDIQLLIDMDRDRIEQVLLNVLSNAIKYTDEKGRIDIDIIKLQGEVQIIISDNGIGIPEKQLSRVFERFFRVDKARSRMLGGTGLGLSISRQIMEEHKGSISLESKLGQGTKVILSLPLAPIRGKRNIL